MQRRAPPTQRQNNNNSSDKQEYKHLLCSTNPWLVQPRAATAAAQESDQTISEEWVALAETELLIGFSRPDTPATTKGAM